MRGYLIKSGCSFVLADGSVLCAGQQLQLPDDVAALHADKLDQLPAQSVPVVAVAAPDPVAVVESGAVSEAAAENRDVRRKS